MENNLRVAVKEDKSEFYRLWQLCFGDSDAFCDWMFENRFYPELSTCINKGEQMISAMQAVPYTISVRGHALKCAMLCGVSTDPAFRKQGLMGQLFRYEMNLLHEKGLALAVHTPAVLPSYFSFGHLPVADANYFTSEKIAPCVASPYIQKDFQDFKKLYPLYTRFTKKYSGILLRTEDEFLRKCADYGADGGTCMILQKNGILYGYLFYYCMENSLVTVEVVAEDGYYHQLLEGFFANYPNYSVNAKLPADLFIHFTFGKVEKQQKGVAGLINIRPILESFSLKNDYTFYVKDDIIRKNNGIMDIQGRPSTVAPAFSISAGHFLQVLLGYANLLELQKSIEIFDEEGFLSINELFPKCKCYIIDEY